MDYLANEKKWQAIWQQTDAHTFKENSGKKKFYMLEMFSYPSGANLHIGHWYNFALSDSFARYKKLKGYEVFQPMGFDAFGLPAENYAIKTGIHPKTSTYQNIEKMRAQIKAMGAMFDWKHELVTCDPSYYKWTQELFVLAMEMGLAVQKEGAVNFCPSCNTVIANEQVVDGACERCDSLIERRIMKQWYLKITDYAEELLSCINDLDWPAKTKLMQQNWIGKSVGGEIEFTTEGGDKIRVFTTRADTLNGVSYIVLAPEHPLVQKLTTPSNQEAVAEYKLMAARQSEIERLAATEQKSGVALGSFALCPLSNRKVPIWIADYVLASYGTGAVMGVPAHDERDFAFATKYKLPIIGVILNEDGSTPQLPFTQDGITAPFEDGKLMSSSKAREAILNALKEKNLGGERISYRLRDWSVSRQRYWGCPIPVIHCEKCGAVAVEREQLPVLLPNEVSFAASGKSPLESNEEFMKAACPKCGKQARREADTLDTFVDSSWYFLRYPDANNTLEPFNAAIAARMLPVDKYVGGAEHACMHLLYARFITKLLRDAGRLKIDEPFTSLTHQGMILGADGKKLSKSKGNTVNPDTYVNKYGSDVLRLHLMFSFNYTEGGPWNEDAVKAAIRFLERVERLVAIASQLKATAQSKNGAAEGELEYALNYAISQADADYNELGFNTCIARLMELVNALYKYMQDENIDNALFKRAVSDLIVLLAPAAPHFAEEMNLRLGNTSSVFQQSFPVADPKKLQLKQVEIVVQINSRPKEKLIIPTSLSNEQIKSLVLGQPSIMALLEGKTIKKVIVIADKLVNIVI